MLLILLSMFSGLLFGACPSFARTWTSGEALCLTPKGGRMPSYFPDGKRIAYVFGTKDGVQELRIFTLADGKSVRLGKIEDAEWPSVSPDGKWIAYLAGPIFARQIYLADVATANAKSLTPEAGFYTRPCWIEGGKRLAFAAGQDEKQCVVSLDPFKPDAPWKTYKHLGQGEPTFSPSGKWVAMVTHDEHGSAHLRILQADGTLHAKVPPVESHSSISPRGCYEPAFTPDGKYLVYVRSDIQPLSNLYLWNLVTNQQSALTTDNSDNQSPCVSPAGRRIVFVATRPNQPRMVFQMNLPTFPVGRE